MRLEPITDVKTLAKIEEEGYAAGARGVCSCGIVAILCIKKFPENPTFTLFFNVYKFE
jgi:hypothetical protein